MQETINAVVTSIHTQHFNIVCDWGLCRVRCHMQLAQQRIYI